MRRPAIAMAGPTYLPFSEIEAYCRLKGIYAHGDRERLIRLIDVLDREWMRAHLEQVEKDQAKGSSTPPPPSHSPPRGGGAPRPPRRKVS